MVEFGANCLAIINLIDCFEGIKPYSKSPKLYIDLSILNIKITIITFPDSFRKTKQWLNLFKQHQQYYFHSISSQLHHEMDCVPMGQIH